MNPAAFLVIGQNGFHAVVLDEAKASQLAAQHHGIVEPLVLYRTAIEVIRGAELEYQRIVGEMNKMRGEHTERMVAAVETAFRWR